MSDSNNQTSQLSNAESLEQAQSEFDAVAKALSAANRAARERGYTVTPEMQRLAGRLNVSQERLKEAKVAFRNAVDKQRIKPTSRVIKQIKKSFSTVEQSAAIEMLERECSLNVSSVNAESSEGRERIELAIIKLANGRLAELRRYIDIAKIDWRDVINFAEHPEASAIGLAEFTKLDEASRENVRFRDMEQYLKWLNEI